MSAVDWPIITPPHPDAVDHFGPGPGPIVLDDDALDALEVMASGTATEPWLMASDAELVTTIPALVAEIRRLRQ